MEIRANKFLFNRALNISYNILIFEEELFNSKIYFLKNKYPKQLIENKINNFLEDNKFDSNTSKQNQITKNRTKSSQEN